MDTVSISLNTPNADEYAAIVRSRFGDAAFPGMLNFAREVRKYVPNVVMTTVETTISHEDEAAWPAHLRRAGRALSHPRLGELVRPGTARTASQATARPAAQTAALLVSADFAPAYSAVSRYGELRLCSISYMVCTFFSS